MASSSRNSLLGNPTELRLEIFRACLVVGLVDATQLGVGPFKPHLSGQLLRVCRQLHDECLPILYGENILMYPDARRLDWSISGVKSDIRFNIKHVCVKRPRGLAGFTKKDAAISTLTGLRSFSIINIEFWIVQNEVETFLLKDKQELASQLIPPKGLLRHLLKKSKNAEVGIIMGGPLCCPLGLQKTLQTDLNGDVLVKYKILPAGKGVSHPDFDLELVLATHDKDKDYRELLPKLRRIGRI